MHLDFLKDYQEYFPVIKTALLESILYINM